MAATKIRAMLLAPLCVLLMAAGPLLLDPPPIAVPAGLTEKAVSQAIRLGVSSRGWIITGQDPGYLEATLHLRSHMAKIGISYDTQAIRIKYLESSNLDYEVRADGQHIHRNYLKWIDNVVHDISVQLSLAEARSPE